MRHDWKSILYIISAEMVILLSATENYFQAISAKIEWRDIDRVGQP